MLRIFNPKTSESNRKRLRSESTLPEQRLWLKLRGKQIEGYKFRRQFGIGNFIVDFYCPELKLAIEVDGDSHAGESVEKYDWHREWYLKKFGVRCLRFTNHDVMTNCDGVAEYIRSITLPNLPLNKGRNGSPPRLRGSQWGSVLPLPRGSARGGRPLLTSP